MKCSVTLFPEVLGLLQLCNYVFGIAKTGTRLTWLEEVQG